MSVELIGAPASGAQTSDGPAVASTAAVATTSGRLLTHPRATAGWRGALREVAVIAAGALAALGAQAWWQDRQDRGREADYLRQLLADTRANERRLEGAVAEDSATGYAIQQLGLALAESGPLPPRDSLVRWTVRTGASSNFQPLTGTYTALIGTGDLRLLRSDSLRTLVVAYAARVESDRAILQLILQMGMGVADLLPRKFPFFRWVFLDRRPEAHARGFDFAPLRDDPEAASMLFRMEAANANRLNKLRDLRAETRRLRRALEVEAPSAVAAPAQRAP